ncbi:unnamed protein product [Cyclocybe aegerita]|uniref:Uncharacterized protein n=1 Tax=Cyclocybe aegerita TaxID=1973307 RepID=A0A8S0VZ07_CYCAE|nr:unnamed protein product [Cyclocybe aegerita]
MLKLLRQWTSQLTKPSGPPLPLEIVELVIDELGNHRDNPECLQALLACALASRPLTQRSQHHVFSRIILSMTRESEPGRLMQRIKALNCITEANPSLTIHIRSFKLSIHGSVEIIRQILESPHMVSVLRMLSKVQLQEVGVTIGVGNHRGANWETCRAFFGALDVLVRSPSLTSLCLENMAGVPTTLIQQTQLKKISLRQLNLVKSSFPPSLSPSLHLESIAVDCSFPFRRLIVPSDDDIYMSDNFAPYPPFPSVKHVSLFIDYSEDIGDTASLLSSCPGLETLRLEQSANATRARFGIITGSHSRIPFVDLPKLRRIVFRYQAPIRYHHPAVALSALRDVLDDQENVAISLEEINIELKIVHEFSLRYAYPCEPAWVAVDAALKAEKWAHVRRVNLFLDFKYKYIWTARDGAFDERVFLKRCQDQLANIFPSLTKSDKVLTLKVVPTHMDPDQTYY